jgi:hypothetical protein
MSPIRAVAVAAPLLLLPLSCAAPSAPQAPLAPVHLAAAPTPPKPPDLTAVADPPALVVSGRLAKPSASLSMVHDWTKMGVPESDDVTEFVMGEAMGPLVDLDQPIDFAVAVAGSGARMRDRTAVSVALKDVEGAKATLAERYKLVAGDNGVFLFQARAVGTHPDTDRGGDDSDDEDPRACEIAPAYGVSPTRLVCGWGSKALSDLAPWLTRTATRAATTSDLHVDLRMQPLRATLSGARRLVGTILATTLTSRWGLQSARELAASAGGDAVDFALDLDTASLDVLLNDPAATATATLRFSGRTSALARVATAHPDRNASPPGAFWQLPGDADFALFERGIDEAELGRGRDLILHVAGDALAQDGLNEADRSAILDALAKLVSSAPLSYASGVDGDAATKALAAVRAHNDASDSAALEEAKRASTEAFLGWRVIELDEPSTRLAGALQELTSAWGKPAIAAALRAKGARGPALHSAPMPKGVKLPPGAQHYVLEWPLGGSHAVPAGKPKVTAGAGGVLPVHVFIAPEGGRTWVGLGGGDALVASKLAAAIGNAPDSLSARAEIGPLKAATVGAAGFFTLRGVPEAAQLLAATLGDRAGAAQEFDELTQLPHHGDVPMWFSLAALPRGATAPVTASLEIPRDAMEDIATAIARHGF